MRIYVYLCASVANQPPLIRPFQKATSERVRDCEHVSKYLRKRLAGEFNCWHSASFRRFVAIVRRSLALSDRSRCQEHLSNPVPRRSPDFPNLAAI